MENEADSIISRIWFKRSQVCAEYHYQSVPTIVVLLGRKHFNILLSNHSMVFSMVPTLDMKSKTIFGYRYYIDDVDDEMLEVAIIPVEV